MSIITAALSSPWMAAGVTAWLMGNATNGMENEKKRFLICAITAVVAAGVIYPIHKSITKVDEPERVGSPLVPSRESRRLDFDSRTSGSRWR